MEKEHGKSCIRRKKTFSCPECGKNYVSENRLQAHRQAEHSNIRYYCQFCSKEFKYNTVLLKHLTLEHQAEKRKYEEMLKQGRDDCKYIVENKLPMDILPEKKLNAIRHYLWYCATDKVMNGNGKSYFTL